MNKNNNKASKYIHIKGAREHNLNNIDILIPRDKLVVMTGLSGSGKSSLAFDTIYAEGQRRYVESLSTYARQFIGLMKKPDIDYIEGLSPAISIEQKSTSKNPRSTVGTITEIYDYLRLLFARIGTQKCYKCNGEMQKQSAQQIINKILKYDKNTRFQILAPIIRGKKGEFKEIISSINKEGFVRARIDGEIINLSENIILKKTKKHNIEIIIDRLIINEGINERLSSSIELGLKVGNGLIIIDKIGQKEKIYSEIAACHKCNISFDDLHPRDFSFNSPFGACKECDGLGTKMSVDSELVIPNEKLSLSQGCIKPIGEQPKGGRYSEILISLSKFYNFSFSTPWLQLDNNIKNIILYGTKKYLRTKKTNPATFKGEFNIEFEGVLAKLSRLYTKTSSGRNREWIEKFMTIQSCHKCNGTRLKEDSLSVYIDNKNISEMTNYTISNLLNFITNIKLSEKKEKISREIIKEIQSR